MHAENAPAPRRGSHTHRHGHLFRVLHWVLTAALLVHLLTGLSLHAVARPERSLFSGVLPASFWSGHVHLWHFGAALVFCPTLLAALVVCPRRVWSRPVHAILLAGGLAMIVTGWLLHADAAPGGSARLVVGLHAAVGLLFLPLAFLWHATSGVTRHRRLLIPAFDPVAQPQWGRLLIFLALAPAAMGLVLAGRSFPGPGRTLVATRISPGESAPADLAALPWEKARPVRTRLANGNGLHAGRTDVTLRALHDGKEVFLRAEWGDPTEERRYTPWKRTVDGWDHLKTNPRDESVYYEDKFALVFPIRSDWRFDRVGCALYCHAGGGNPYGCKYSDRLVDVWHWKAVRTDAVGQADDKYWFRSESATKRSGRYGDPEQPGSGYKPNDSPDQRHPAFLPGDPTAARLGAIRKADAIEYTEERAARIPPGTIVPGIVCAPFAGDRGDVRCQSTHRAGRWSLFLRRRLDTGSEFDVRLEPGTAHAFACAAFDHTSKRHAYSFSVFRLSIR